MASNFTGSNGLLYLLQKIKLAFAGKVDKVDGKGLSTNDLTDELKQKILNAGDSSFSGNYSDLTGAPTELSAFNNDVGYQTSAQVESTISAKGYQTATQVAEAINNSTKISKEIVESLPEVSSAKENVIYMILKDGGTGNDVYDEYMLVNGKLEMVGNSEVDLNGYWNESNLSEISNSEIDNIWNTVFTE